jgi:hypothetical protein
MYVSCRIYRVSFLYHTPQLRVPYTTVILHKCSSTYYLDTCLDITKRPMSPWGVCRDNLVKPQRRKALACCNKSATPIQMRHNWIKEDKRNDKRNIVQRDFCLRFSASGQTILGLKTHYHPLSIHPPPSFFKPPPALMMIFPIVYRQGLLSL